MVSVHIDAFVPILRSAVSGMVVPGDMFPGACVFPSSSGGSPLTSAVVRVWCPADFGVVCVVGVVSSVALSVGMSGASVSFDALSMSASAVSVSTSVWSSEWCCVVDPAVSGASAVTGRSVYHCPAAVSVLVVVASVSILCGRASVSDLCSRTAGVTGSSGSSLISVPNVVYDR